MQDFWITNKDALIVSLIIGIIVIILTLIFTDLYKYLKSFVKKISYYIITKIKSVSFCSKAKKEVEELKNKVAIIEKENNNLKKEIQKLNPLKWENEYKDLKEKETVYFYSLESIRNATVSLTPYHGNISPDVKRYFCNKEIIKISFDENNIEKIELTEKGRFFIERFLEDEKNKLKKDDDFIEHDNDY